MSDFVGHFVTPVPVHTGFDTTRSIPQMRLVARVETVVREHWYRIVNVVHLHSYTLVSTVAVHVCRSHQQVERPNLNIVIYR